MTAAAKLVIVGCAVAAIGVPALATYQALLCAAALLVVVFGDLRARALVAIAAAIGVATVAIAARAVLPRADIAEGHQAFLVLHPGETLERSLPAEVFTSWKAQFDALYPPEQPPYSPRSQWRLSGVPSVAYAESSDAIWRPARYSRQVDSIDFTSLADFRGGFANELQYNFWSGELLREQMPFYVMYQLTPAAAGSAMWWSGEAFWQRADGSYDRLVHSAPAARVITPADAGRRVYAAFFPKRDPHLAFRFAPSSRLRAAADARIVVTIAATLGLLLVTMRVRWRSFARAAALFSAAYGLMAAFIVVSAGKYLGRAYPPQGGGDDGMVHDGWGRMMAMLAGHGRIAEALRGTESVYWFTPGTRYVRMVEKLIFGDTNHLFAILVCCVPIVMFYLVRHIAGVRAAWVAAVGFLLLPVENPSFLQYLVNAKLGYGEAIGGGAFLLGLALLLRTQPAWGGTQRAGAATMLGGAALASSMFIRPNFALAVVWVGAAYAWLSWRRGDLAAVAMLAAGLGCALWMPFHNWYFGHEFHLISKSGATVSVPLGVGDYLAAAADLARGGWHSAALTTTSHQVRGWLMADSFILHPLLRPVAWAAHAVKLVALLWTCWVAARGASTGFTRHPALGMVAVAALCAHLPMLFIFATNYRYAMLGWDLSVIVLFLSIVDRRRPVATIAAHTAVA